MTHPPSGPSTPSPPPGPKDQPRTMAEAAAELGVSHCWLKRKVAARAVPFFRPGRNVVFFDRHIEAIKQQYEVAPKAAPVPRIARGRRVA